MSLVAVKLLVKADRKSIAQHLPIKGGIDKNDGEEVFAAIQDCLTPFGVHSAVEIVKDQDLRQQADDDGGHGKAPLFHEAIVFKKPEETKVLSSKEERHAFVLDI